MNTNLPIVKNTNVPRRVNPNEPSNKMHNINMPTTVNMNVPVSIPRSRSTHIRFPTPNDLVQPHHHHYNNVRSHTILRNSFVRQHLRPEIFSYPGTHHSQPLHTIPPSSTLQHTTKHTPPISLKRHADRLTAESSYTLDYNTSFINEGQQDTYINDNQSDLQYQTESHEEHYDDHTQSDTFAGNNVERDIFGLPIGNNATQSVHHDSSHVSTNNLNDRNTYIHNMNIHNGNTEKNSDGIPFKGLTLRVVSSTIVEIRKLFRYRNHIPAMFELIGKCSSDLTVGKFDYEKKVLLKDNTGSVNCVYYEVDRKLDCMMRGRSYRCIGTMKSPNFHCVSIRIADEEEIKLFTTKVQMSQRLLKQVIILIKEM